MPTMQGTHELLDLRPADQGLPLLGLEINDIEAEPILIDDVIDASSAGRPTAWAASAKVPPVTHGHQQLHHQLLEGCRRRPLDLLQQFIGQVLLQLPMDLLQQFLGCSVGDGVRNLWG